MKKVLMYTLVSVGIMSFSLPFASADFSAIECSSNPVFAENSCNQCFDGGKKSEGANIGALDDIWVNSGKMRQIMYKEAQNFPKMINLNSDKVVWTQKPSTEDFWEYTKELDALYDADKGGYILDGGKQVVWLQSKLASAYSLTKNEVEQGEDVGLLVFPVTVNNILEDGEISAEINVHNECVLFKSSGKKTPPTPDKPKALPKTGPAQYLLLLILAMALALGVLRFKKG